MTDNIYIKYADPEDADIIAFFNYQMALETESLELDREVVRDGVRNLIKQSDQGFYIVAKSDYALCGSLMITKEWSDWRNGLIWWIQSVYIRPEYRKKGIFRKMYRYVLDLAKQNKIIGLRLYVEKNNAIAQQTYNALGMQETAYRIYEQIL